MGKTKQRKNSMWQQGRQDALSGYGNRWSRHRMMGYYRAGFNAGQREIERKEADSRKPLSGFAGWVYRLICKVVPES